MATRGLKICLGVSALFLIIVAAVIVTLILTIFKPKNPDISVDPVDLENFQISLYPNLTVNVTLGMVITIVNPNYASFRYINSTGYVNYHDYIVAQVPIETELVPARSKISVSTSADLMAGKLIYDLKFWSDVSAGLLNLTSTASLPGKVSILNIFKLKATAYSSCDISVNISSRDIGTTCTSKIKI